MTIGSSKKWFEVNDSRNQRCDTDFGAELSTEFGAKLGVERCIESICKFGAEIGARFGAAFGAELYRNLLGSTLIGYHEAKLELICSVSMNRKDLCTETSWIENKIRKALPCPNYSQSAISLCSVFLFEICHSSSSSNATF